MKTDLILLSGGMDSTTALYEFRDSIGLAIGFDYGSKHADKELAAARLLADGVRVPFKVVKIDLSGLDIKSNLLKEGGDIPNGHYEDKVMKSTVVPFRNGILISIAASIAESNALNRIIIANHAGDHAIYPDCREDFMVNMGGAIRCGTYNNISLFAPYMNITKRDIAIKGVGLGVPYLDTWSCYKGMTLHCGECGTCVERKEALCGFDNTPYTK